VGARYGELADEAAREGTPHRDYLAHLFEMELDDRGQRRPNPTSCAPNGALITKLSVLRISPG
jgi:hypothetical protein